MTKIYNSSYNLTESSNFKLEGVPNLKDPYFPEVSHNSYKSHNRTNFP